MKSRASKRPSPFVRGSLAILLLAAAGSAEADRITLRIATGHPPGVVYAGLMQTYFQAELERRVEERTEHTINFIEGYSGSLGTSFDWNTVEDLQGVKIAGAGLNLNWLRYAGATPVQGALPGSIVLETALDAAERHGYVWPVRYELR